MEIKFFGRDSESLTGSKKVQSVKKSDIPENIDKALVEELRGTLVAIYCFYDSKGMDKSELLSSGLSLEEISLVIKEAKEVGIYDAAVVAYSLGAS